MAGCNVARSRRSFAEALFYAPLCRDFSWRGRDCHLLSSVAVRADALHAARIRKIVGTVLARSACIQRESAMFARLPLYLRLVRMDKPIGGLLLLLARRSARCGSRPTVVRRGRSSRHLYGGHDIDALGGLRHQRLRRSRFRPLSCKRTENRPITSGKIKAWKRSRSRPGCRLLAFLLILPLNTLTKELSVAALFVAGSYPFTSVLCDSAGVSRHRVRLRHSDGVRGRAESGADARRGHAAGQRVLVRRVRRRICDGRSRRRHPDRHSRVRRCTLAASAWRRSCSAMRRRSASMSASA